MKKNQSGFTLIEIAIVMVIIGLLLGGVLKGQSMINSAKVRSLNNKVDGISAAWFAFQDRYRAIPGDMTLTAAQAQIDPLATGPAASNGHVNTSIKSSMLWNQLSLAGFITGSYAGTVVAPINTCPSSAQVCPDNGFGLGMVIFYPGSAAASAPFAAPGNYLYTGQNTPVQIIAELDRKIDDGIPRTGSVGSNIPACYNGAGAASTYNITVPSNNCSLVIDKL